MHLERIVDTFMELSRELYYYGSNATEIESYIKQVGYTYDLDVQIASIGTVLYITVIDKTGTSLTRIERIENTSIDFEKLSIWESLIKKILKEKPPFIFLRTEIKRIKEENKNLIHSFSLLIIAVFMASFSFSFVFKGNFLESMISGIVGTTVYYVTINLKNKILRDFIAGFSIYSIIQIFNIFIDIRTYPILAGSIMVFVPGLLLTNAIMEIGDRNLVSGISKLVESVFILGALVLGAGIGTAIWR